MSYEDKVIATGLPASPGAAVGQIVFTAVDAETWHSQGKSVVLVRILLIFNTLASLYISIYKAVRHAFLFLCSYYNNSF